MAEGSHDLGRNLGSTSEARFININQGNQRDVVTGVSGDFINVHGNMIQVSRFESKFTVNKRRRVALSDLQEELEKRLLYVNPVLDDAEGKQLNNPTVKAWLGGLKEAVYNAEDVLQEIKTEALRQKMEPESPGSSTSTVQELDSSPASHGFASALIISEADEVLERLDFITKERKDVLGLEVGAGPKVYQPIDSTCLLEESGVYGRDNEQEAFIKLLLSDDEKLSVIPIVGMGGIGKTTLAQLLYNDVRVEEHFEIQAWASVSKEFDVLRISQLIYESLIGQPCQIQSINLLQSNLKKTLARKKFFVVLDDIWNKNYDLWDRLKRPLQFGAYGSKIIVTTRNEDVASMVGTLQPHCLMPISENDGWLLLETHAFKSRGVGGHSHLEDIGRQIVTKCKGLPLAIKTLGGLLCSELTVGKWKSILNSDIWKLPQEESGILPSLWLSYMHLPLHLKRCFAYCSLFPKNYTFQTSELVFLWMAEDLLQPENQKTAEEIGKDYFNDLMSRSFFQVPSRTCYCCFKYFLMHDLINDLANFVFGEFCLRWEDSDSPNNLSKIRHLSCTKKYNDDDDKFEALQQAKCLRTFLPLAPYLSIKWLDRALHEVLPKLQCLRMLRLTGSNIEDLRDSVNNLKHLRHMDISHSGIKKLPDTICTLYNLQALLLSGCYNLTELPPNFGRLINLTHVDIEGTMLTKMPQHMGNLEDLQVLTNFVLDKHSARDNLPELKKLQNLRGKLEISGLVHGSGLEAYILRDKKFLNELSLKWGYYGPVGSEGNALEEREVLEKLQPNPDLERLTIDRYRGEMFPGWLRCFSSPALVYLKLSECANCKSLPPLGQLPSLKELHIFKLPGVVSIGHEFYYSDDNSFANKPFRSLQSLTVEDMSGWEEWSHVGDGHNEGGLFPSLSKLHLLGCPTLTGKLALDSFPMLKEVLLEEIGFSHLTSSKECPELVSLKLLVCPNFVSFPDGGLHAPNLTEIEISFGEKLGSWPEQMPTLLPSLENLLVFNCPELESFPEGGLPAQLKSLQIEDCKKFSANSLQNLKKGLRRLTTLETLSLNFDGCEDVDSFPEETGVFPSTLTRLCIFRLNLKTMDGGKWFGHLNSLETLEFFYCRLGCLPDTGLPASLRTIRCEREIGEDWPKIAHIDGVIHDDTYDIEID